VVVRSCRQRGVCQGKGRPGGLETGPFGPFAEATDRNGRATGKPAYWAPLADRSDRHYDRRWELVFHVFGALAEFERSVIRERMKAGLDAARARGKKGGRPPALAAKDLAAAKAMLSDPEVTMEEVAKRLQVAPSTLYRHLPGGWGALRETESS
jgi:hypothetical protein